MAKKEKNNFEATTVDLVWNGETHRVHPNTAKAIKSRKDYSAEAPKTEPKKEKEPKEDK